MRVRDASGSRREFTQSVRYRWYGHVRAQSAPAAARVADSRRKPSLRRLGDPRLGKRQDKQRHRVREEIDVLTSPCFTRYRDAQLALTMMSIKYFIALAAVLLAGSGAAAAESSLARGWGDGIEWHTLQVGRELAREHGKALMVVVWRSWCGACKYVMPQRHARRVAAA
jgi:hypothetical protein